MEAPPSAHVFIILYHLLQCWVAHHPPGVHAVGFHRSHYCIIAMDIRHPAKILGRIASPIVPVHVADVRLIHPGCPRAEEASTSIKCCDMTLLLAASWKPSDIVYSRGHQVDRQGEG